jgi:hypothetical protein
VGYSVFVMYLSSSEYDAQRVLTQQTWSSLEVPDGLCVAYALLALTDLIGAARGGCRRPAGVHLAHFAGR